MPKKDIQNIYNKTNIMGKTFIERVAWTFLFLWQLPQNLVGIFMWLYFKFNGGVEKIDSTKWSTAYSASKMRGGISLGNFCFLSKNLSKHEESIAHELKGHTWDSRLFGPLYLLVIGLPSIMNASMDFTKCYYDWFPEKWANRHAGLICDENCRLKFKNEKTPA